MMAKSADGRRHGEGEEEEGYSIEQAGGSRRGRPFNGTSSAAEVRTDSNSPLLLEGTRRLWREGERERSASLLPSSTVAFSIFCLSSPIYPVGQTGRQADPLWQE